ncbi:MAG: diphosphomevalonate decarboxylase [Candidatus Aenigmarchaeota archaeon]|nr:diphosphomevalonate decarboxylase [Candidatus Aenigmarchaeota archaeon]MDI6722135.1 diphosphomevalonate decarboxylase [Candidatus Aenigmarchaeota archaeon]
MKSTAIANANIALVKYWGKRDSRLILPYNDSISMTCDGMHTKTTIEFSGKYDRDTITINDEELKKDEKDILGHIERIRKMAGIMEHVKIISESNFPVAAGLASSASGLAALTLAASKAAGLSLSERELTILARQGSGSACRSICEGFVEWHKGAKSDGSDSYADTIASKNHWPEFRMIATIVKESKKKVSSRAGMKQTVETCPLYKGWLDSVENDLKNMHEGIKKKDFTRTGSTAESSALKMHATMMTTNPAIIYWIPATVEIMNSIIQWREEGLELYFTMDAGPNVKVMCLEKDEKEITRCLMGLDGVIKTISCRPGEGASISDSHLF